MQKDAIKYINLEMDDVVGPFTICEDYLETT